MSDCLVSIMNHFISGIIKHRAGIDSPVPILTLPAELDSDSVLIENFDTPRSSNYIKLPIEPLSEPPESPTSVIRTTSSGLLAPTACRIAILIAAKNGAMTTATVAMTTGWKARAPGNFVNADQITPYAADQTFCLKISRALIFF